MLGLAVTDPFLFAAWIYDWRTLGRVRPVLLWGGLLHLASQPLRFLIAGREAWQVFAGKLIG
ncbi:MAG TPA: hypothetical protein VGW38_10295 [Chloroflexota bacterium]|nr:hypothetical protein [Chloroflexota bacterium]